MSANSSLWAKSGLLPTFANKVLLIHNHTHSLTHCPWYFLATVANLSGCNSDAISLAKLKFIGVQLPRALHRKSFPTSAL